MRQAVKALLPNVNMIETWMDLAERIATAVDDLTKKLQGKTLEQDTATAAALFKILAFIWKFGQAPAATATSSSSCPPPQGSRPSANAAPPPPCLPARAQTKPR